MLEKKISLRLLDERTIKTMMNRFHASVVGSTNNALSIIENNPEDINPENAEGNRFAQDGLRAFSVWLKILSDFSKNQDVFTTQFLEPVRIACEFIVNIRKIKGGHSTTANGFVLGKSRPHVDMESGQSWVSMVVLIPEIESVMSLRAGAVETSDTSHGFYKIDNLQPIPLVNRIHLTRTHLAKIGSISNMTQCNFLKTSFGDLGHLENSVEMEKFFEMQMSRNQGTHLFSAVLVSAKIESVNLPFATLRDLIKDEVITASFSNYYMSSKPKSFFYQMAKNNARILVAMPFWDGVESKQSPEILYIEPDVELEELEADDLTGYVRMRDAVDISEIRTRYPRVNLSQISAVSVIGSNVSYVKNLSSSDQVKTEFLRAMEKISSLRRAGRPSEHLQLNARDVLDYEKMNIEGVSKFIKGIPVLLEILRIVYFRNDSTGKIPSWDNLALITKFKLESVKKIVVYLDSIGLLKNDDGLISETSLGKEILYTTYHPEIEKYVATRSDNIISIPDFRDEHIPQSLLLEYLSDNKNTYQPLSLPKGTTELFWMKKIGNVGGNRISAEIEFESFANSILFVMSSQNYPFTAEKVVDEMAALNRPVTYFVASIVLNDLGKMGRIVPSGESWEYTRKSRIIDLLRNDPKGCHTIEEIISKNCIPLLERKSVESILSDMAASSVIVEISPNLWCIAEDAQKRFGRYVAQKIKPKILAMLKEKGHIVAESGIVRWATKEKESILGNGIVVSNIDDVVRLCLGDLVSEGSVVFQDDYYKIKEVS